MRVLFVLSVAALLVFSAALCGAQSLYEYKDQSGAVVITDKPPGWVKNKPIPGPEPEQALPPAVQGPSPSAVTAEEAIRQRDQMLEQTVKSVESRERERELEKQKRLEQADRLEAEARESVPATRENRQRQYQLMKEAERLRQEPVKD